MRTTLSFRAKCPSTITWGGVNTDVQALQDGRRQAYEGEDDRFGDDELDALRFGVMYRRVPDRLTPVACYMRKEEEHDQDHDQL